MNSRLRTSGLVLCLPILATLAFASTASAQRRDSDDAVARNLFNSGRAYFDAARYDDAAEAFGEAYRLSHRPQLLVNQARALEAAHRRDDAIAVLEQAQRELPEAQVDLRTEVEGRLNRLRAEAERERLDAEARAAAEAEAAAAAGDATTSSGADVPSPRRGRFIVGVSTGGLAVASLGVALGTGLRSNAIENDLEGACPGDVCPANRADDVTRGRRLARTNTALLFVAAGSAAVAIPFLIQGIRDLRGEDEEPAPVAITGGPGDVGLGVDVRF